MAQTNTSTEQFLRPEDIQRLGDATLRVSVPMSELEKDRPRHFIIEIFDLKPTLQPNGVYLTLPAPPRSFVAQQFVERRFEHGWKRLDKKGIYHPIYQVPMTDYSVNLIMKAWTGKREIHQTAKDYFRKIFLREAEADFNATRYAEYKHNDVVPTNAWFEEHKRKLLEKGLSLNPYQQTAAFNACKTNSYGLLMDPGTGKTCIMITKMDYVIEHSNRQTTILVLCPKNIRTNWQNEIDKFSVNTDKIYVVEIEGGNPTDRTVNFINSLSNAGEKHIVIIAGYEQYVQTPALQEWEFDLCLLDESQNIASPITKRTKTLLEHRNKFANVIIATGTPFRNTPFDIFTQLEFLGEGYSGHITHGEFKQFYGKYAQGYNGKAQLEGFQRIPLMQEKLVKHTFGIRKSEALPHLPKKTFTILDSSLTDEQLKVYINLTEILTAEIETYGDEPDAVTVNNILTQLLRLAQITSGFVTTDSGLINRFDPNPKLDLLIRLLQGSTDADEDDLPGILPDPNRKAIIWACFHPNIAQIKARLELEGIQCVTFHGKLDREQKDDAVEQFNCNRDVRAFIGTAASGGVGLNLVGFDPRNPSQYETNCTDVIYYSSNWSYDKRTQSMERAHRYITRVPIQVWDLLVPRSIDTEIYQRLQLKKEMDYTIQDVKNILGKLISRLPQRY